MNFTFPLDKQVQAHEQELDKDKQLAMNMVFVLEQVLDDILVPANVKILAILPVEQHLHAFVHIVQFQKDKDFVMNVYAPFLLFINKLFILYYIMNYKGKYN